VRFPRLMGPGLGQRVERQSRQIASRWAHPKKEMPSRPTTWSPMPVGRRWFATLWRGRLIDFGQHEVTNVHPCSGSFFPAAKQRNRVKFFCKVKTGGRKQLGLLC
jgi:hypothetical protein